MAARSSSGAAALRKGLISRRFGEILRQHRLARGWSQSTLSMKSRVDRTYISQIECGIHSPTITVLCKLSRALQVSPSLLVTRLERRLGIHSGRQ
jgi:transcriptional regulator with XRE-family HTH domain